MPGWSIPNRARTERAEHRRSLFLSALSDGRMVKQAAGVAGVSQRTASRYRREAGI